MKGERGNRQSIGWTVAVTLFSTSTSAQIIQYNYATSPAHAPLYDSFYNFSYDRNGNLSSVSNLCHPQKRLHVLTHILGNANRFFGFGAFDRIPLPGITRFDRVPIHRKDPLHV